jgi:hypothetical protein
MRALRFLEIHVSYNPFLYRRSCIPVHLYRHPYIQVYLTHTFTISGIMYYIIHSSDLFLYPHPFLFMCRIFFSDKYAADFSISASCK